MNANPMALPRPAGEATRESSRPAPVTISPLKYGALQVLVVEDAPPSREGLARMIRLLGHECRTARDGQEALAMHQEQHADVIVSDCRMPRMDGLELCTNTSRRRRQARRSAD